MNEWTAAEIKHVTLRWIAGDSSRQIGDAIGKTRNQVIGKAHRLRLPGRTRPGRPPPPPAAPQRRAGVRTWARTPKLPKLKPAPSGVPVGTWEPLPGSVPVVALDPGMCNWPIGLDRPYRFCGVGTEGVYCAVHAARAVGRDA